MSHATDKLRAEITRLRGMLETVEGMLADPDKRLETPLSLIHDVRSFIREEKDNHPVSDPWEGFLAEHGVTPCREPWERQPYERGLLS